MAERANATIVDVPASHVSFVSQPEAATQLILQAVEAIQRRRAEPADSPVALLCGRRVRDPPAGSLLRD